jgi:hypothetical protein
MSIKLIVVDEPYQNNFINDKAETQLMYCTRHYFSKILQIVFLFGKGHSVEYNFFENIKSIENILWHGITSSKVSSLLLLKSKITYRFFSPLD